MTIEEKKERLIEYVETDIERLNKQEELISRQKEYFIKKKKRLEEYNIFSKSDANEIISYLVSKVEERPFSIEKYDVETESKVFNKRIVFEFSFLYLVDDTKKEDARNEIKNKYEIKEVNGRNVIETSSNMKQDDISDNYVKLSLYNKYSHNRVIFTDKNITDTISINIQDERFQYINEFINIVLDERLNRNNCDLSMDAIKNMADNFALKEKNNKKLVLESE